MEKALAEKTGGYLIGDVAQMVGLSRDALRFYEKKGIIRADKKENGYRYYSEDDIYRLMYILYHRKMNTSLEEIGGLMSGQNSTSAMRQHVRQRMAEEEEALRRHSQAIMRLKLVEKDISRIEACMGRYSIRKFPKAFVMANCSDLQEGLRTWFKLSSTIPGLDMAYFYNVLTYTGQDLEEKGTQLLLYEGLEKGLGQEFDRSLYSMTEEPECIYTCLLYTSETKAIRLALGDHAEKVKINSTKSMIGHLLGAAGGVEFITCVKSIQDGFVHATVGLEKPGEGCDLDYTMGVGVSMNVDVAISNSLGFGGHNASLIVKKFSE